MKYEETRRVDQQKHTHFPKDRNCEICQRTKITRALCRRRNGEAVLRAANFGDLITADHKVLSDNRESRNNHRYAVVVQDLATRWIQAYPCKTKTSQETQRSLQKFLEPERKPKVIYTYNSLEFGKACEDCLGIIARLHHTDQRQMGFPRDQCAEWKCKRIISYTSYSRTNDCIYNGYDNIILEPTAMINMNTITLMDAHNTQYWAHCAPAIDAYCSHRTVAQVCLARVIPSMHVRVHVRDGVHVDHRVWLKVDVIVAIIYAVICSWIWGVGYNSSTERRDTCGAIAIRSKWKLVGRFYGML